MRIAYKLAILIGCCASGCQRPLKPIFPEANPPIVWPKAPDQPRIRYVGQLTGEESLGAPVKGLEALGALFTGPKPKAGFSTPMAVACRGDVVYVADGQNQAVFILNLQTRQFGAIRQAAGKPLQWPIDLAILGDNLVVADSQRATVFFFDAAGNYQRSLGEGTLKRPAALAANKSTGELWVLDTAAHDCKVFDAAGQLKKHFGERGAATGQFNFPVGIGAERDFGVAIADSMNFRVQLLAYDGTPKAMFGQKGDAAGDFALPRDVAIDSQQHLYVLDNQFENVQIFDNTGHLLMAFGQEGRGPGEFYLPSGITIDDQDRIWIADTYNRRIQVFQFVKEAQP